jgi:hypothetical protein
MRLVSRKLWRAFRELDVFDDATCEAALAQARGGAWRRRLRTALQVVAAGLAFLVPLGALGHYARGDPLWLRWGISYSGRPVLLDRFVLGPLEQGIMALLLDLSWIASALFIIGIATASLVAWLLTRDVLLWFRIRYLLRRVGACMGCRHSLVGGPVINDQYVRCSECGVLTPIELGASSIQLGTDGQPRYLPTGDDRQRALPPIISKTAQRRIAWVVMLALGIPVVAWSVWFGIRWIMVIPARSDILHMADLPSLVEDCTPPGVQIPPDRVGQDGFSRTLAPMYRFMGPWMALRGEGGVPVLTIGPGTPDHVTGESSGLVGTTVEDLRKAHDSMLAAGLVDVLRQAARAESEGIITTIDPDRAPVGRSWWTESLLICWGIAYTTFDRALKADDVDLSMTALEAMLAIEARVAQLPSIEERERAAEMGHWGVSCVADLLERHPDAATVEAISARVAAHAWRPPMEATLRAHRRTALGALAWVVADPSDLMPFFEEGVRRAVVLSGGYTVNVPREPAGDDASWSELRGEIGAWFDALSAQQRTEPWLRAAFAPPAHALAKAAIMPGAAGRGWGEGAGSHSGARGRDSVSRALDFPGRSELQRDEALRAVLAVARWRIERGTAPTSLSALVPEFLPSEPIDPRTGQPMTLTVEDRPGGRVWVLRQGEDVVVRLPAP